MEDRSPRVFDTADNDTEKGNNENTTIQPVILQQETIDEVRLSCKYTS